MPFALGLGAVALLLWAAGAFSRASIGSVKALGAWVLALAGLCLLAALLLSGRGSLALGALVLLGPLVWDRWRGSRGAGPGAGAGASGTGASGTGASGAGARAGPRLGRAEAYAVLGLPDGASEADIQAAWVRLMRGVHPDSGGTDWLASRVNAARDTLLRR